MKTLVALSFAAVSLAASAANIVLVGDSTLAPRAESVRNGSWGDALKPSLAPGNGVVNRAVGGRTVRTTLPGWTNSLEKISKGDFVIIQFGINDAAKNKLVEEDEFKKTIAQFADDVLAKGATPVICSPISWAGYGKNGKPGDSFNDKNNASRRKYGDFAKTVAEEKKLDYVDMTALTSAELAKIGRDAALECYLCDVTRDGKEVFDTTHPTKAGAKRFAELFIADVRSRKLPIAKLFKVPEGQAAAVQKE